MAQQRFHWGGGGKTTALFYVLENSVKRLLVHKYAHTALIIYIYEASLLKYALLCATMIIDWHKTHFFTNN